MLFEILKHPLKNPLQTSVLVLLMVVASTVIWSFFSGLDSFSNEYLLFNLFCAVVGAVLAPFAFRTRGKKKQ